jgi:glycosyltransferase involved in cell wall biosynthesis
MDVTNASPLVTVIVPAWHHEEYAEATLQSVCEQDHDAIEIIVVDDGSQPRVSRAIRDYLDRGNVRPRFHRTVHVEGSGCARIFQAINRGLGEANGRFITVLEAGDVLPATRFSRLVSTGAEREALLAFSRVEFRVVATSVSAVADYLYSVQDDIEFFPTVGYALLKSFSAVCIGNLFFSRALADSIGGFGEFDYVGGWEFALRSLLLTEPLFVPEPLYVRRVPAHQPGAQQRQLEARETEAALKNYLFHCRNRRVANPIAPSPAWGPFFDSFVVESRYAGYLVKP